MAITGSDMKALREMMRETVRESEDRLGARLDGVVARHSAASQQVALDAVTRTVSRVALGIERQVSSQLVPMQADLNLALDKLDALEHDVKETRTLLTQTPRETLEGVRRAEADQKGGVTNATEIEVLERIDRLTARINASVQGG